MKSALMTTHRHESASVRVSGTAEVTDRFGVVEGLDDGPEEGSSSGYSSLLAMLRWLLLLLLSSLLLARLYRGRRNNKLTIHSQCFRIEYNCTTWVPNNSKAIRV